MDRKKTKAFFAFVKKEIIHIWRDRRTMLILLGIPIAQVLIFGFAISTEIRNVNYVVMDASADQLSGRIIDRISQSSYFTLAGRVTSMQQAEDLFKKGNINLVLVLPEHLESAMLHQGVAQIQMIVDASDPNQANMIINYAGSILNSEAADLSKEWGRKQQFQIKPQVRMLFNPQMKAAYNFVPGVMGMILLLICAMMTSIAIVREKERGTMEILLVSPIRPIWVIVAKMVPFFLLSCINIISILLLAVFVLGVPIAGSIGLLAFLEILFILVALSLGMFVSSIVDTQVAAMLVSGMVFMLPTTILSGMMFPIESMPWPLQWISAILPVRWFIAAIRKIMIEGVEFRFVLKEILILLAMFGVFMGVSLKKFKKRLE